MTILGLTESLKTMKRPDPIRHGPTVTLVNGLFLGSYKKKGREILTQSLFKSSISVIEN